MFIWKIKEKNTHLLFPTQVQVFKIDLRIDFYPNLGGSWPLGFPSIKLSVRWTIPPLPWEHLSDNIVYSLAKEKDSLVKGKKIGSVAVLRRLKHYVTIFLWFFGLKLLHILMCVLYTFISNAIKSCEIISSKIICNSATTHTHSESSVFSSKLFCFEIYVSYAICGQSFYDT